MAKWSVPPILKRRSIADTAQPRVAKLSPSAQLFLILVLKVLDPGTPPSWANPRVTLFSPHLCAYPFLKVTTLPHSPSEETTDLLKLRATIYVSFFIL